ncbi:cytochrome c biogenesis protein DipZ [Ramlibacter sp. G-1-2-2]|uniref:Cytochrome c biogenesis protein DipZ n=1 Tax=Ramlibacter agri TaxID=2728837 RepID=A0A848GYB5_9BURK|nr:cytochrome c biogenesis protein DipZ [Ramlibacter agri]NML43324.1 cytochrome c biogenesis protein DipZ [Ramlibacter agri]
MTLYLVAFLGGLLTILSPCILPVLPFVFARNDRPFAQGSLPLLAGMAVAFAAVASLGAVAGAWAAQLNQFGRWAALASLALFASSLLLPRLAAWWTRPLVSAGERLARTETGTPWLTSALLGVATGLVWSPCAGPILGVILSTAALAGPSARTSLLLLSFGAGAGVSLWAALRLGARLKRQFAPGRSARGLAGVAMLAGVVAVATGLDGALLARFSSPDGVGLEAGLLQRAMPAANAAEPRPSVLPIESTRVSLEGGSNWLNAGPQSIASLRGKVVLVNFWTYSCINCLRTLPYVKAWSEKYRDRGLVVVGVHAPEFAFEREAGNVQEALRDLGISYPVVQDNQFRIWRAFGDQYWPALYVLDAQGRVRHHQFGEGGYAASERVIEDLLREAGAPAGAATAVQADTRGVGLAADAATLRSGETYLGYEKAAGPRVAVSAVPDQPVNYRPDPLLLNTWSLAGNWTLRPEWVEANEPGGALSVRFQARDANLVLGPAAGQPVRFRVLLDGQPPGPDHGADVDAQGNGVADASRLYQLVRQGGAVKPRTVEIRFLDAGARGYAFTFG